MFAKYSQNLIARNGRPRKRERTCQTLHLHARVHTQGTRYIPLNIKRHPKRGDGGCSRLLTSRGFHESRAPSYIGAGEKYREHAQSAAPHAQAR